MQNKVIGDIDLVAQGNQFREEGSKHIVPPPVFGEFDAVFTDLNLRLAHFSDFSQRYPYLLDTAIEELDAPNNIEVSLFDDFRLRSFDATEDGNIDSNTWNGVMSKYLPWIYAVDVTGARSFSYSVKLLRKAPNAVDYGWKSPPDAYGFVDVQTSGGATPAPTDNTTYEYIIKSSVNLTVKAIGLFYDMDIITP